MHRLMRLGESECTTPSGGFSVEAGTRAAAPFPAPLAAPPALLRHDLELGIRRLLYRGLRDMVHRFTSGTRDREPSAEESRSWVLLGTDPDRTARWEAQL
jgi:hypothetical protein